MNTFKDYLYLREEVYFEPLINKWYAWPYLVPPITRAMNMAGRQIRLMKSFVQEHQLHILANKDKQLAGGDFVACSEDQLNDVRALVTEVERDYRVYFEIRRAVAALQATLEQVDGRSLEALYAEIPDILDGYVELTYDMNHKPSIRFLESLLYASPLNMVSAQSMAFGCLQDNAERPFVLSSPRLPDERHLHINAPFDAAAVDQIFAMRTTPAHSSTIDKLFAGLDCRGGPNYRELFSAEAPRYRHAPPSSGVRVRFIGHAGVLFETAAVSVLIDPVIPSRTASMGDSVISFAELPERIDYICITHTHMDHLCLETLLQLRHKTGQVLVPKSNGGGIADPSIKLMLASLGFKVAEVDEMDMLPVKDGSITAIPFLGEHADLNIRSKSAWFIQLHGKKFLCMADSACLSDALYRHIRAVIGKVDMLLIGMECIGAPMTWLYGALFTKPVPREINESRRFNGSDFVSAKRMVDIFEPDEVYVYALGMEPWSRYFMGIHYDEDARQIQESDQLIVYCRERGIAADRLMSARTWNF